MSELVIAEKNDLVNIANEIRQLTGQTKGLNLQEMQTGLKSIDNQPDWNQNDPNAKDYIKNRPGGYAVAPSFEITWDGDTTGKETGGPGDGLTLVKIADEAPPIDVFDTGNGCRAVIAVDVEYGNGNHETKQGEIELLVGDELWIGEYNDVNAIVLGAVADHVSIDGCTLSKGLWVSVFEEMRK